jgi:hypothetical protein
MLPGRYKAFVVDKIIGETKNGDPQAVIQFEVEVGDGTKQTMNYYGSFKEKAVEHTIKALAACGIKGNNPADPVTKGTEVSVVVVEDVDLEGNKRMKIAWVNKPMGMGDAMDEMRAKNALSKFEGALAAMRSKTKIKNFADDIPSYDDDEKIPF